PYNQIAGDVGEQDLASLPAAQAEQLGPRKVREGRVALAFGAPDDRGCRTNFPTDIERVADLRREDDVPVLDARPAVNTSDVKHRHLLWRRDWRFLPDRVCNHFE